MKKKNELPWCFKKCDCDDEKLTTHCTSDPYEQSGFDRCGNCPWLYLNCLKKEKQD